MRAFFNPHTCLIVIPKMRLVHEYSYGEEHEIRPEYQFEISHDLDTYSNSSGPRWYNELGFVHVRMLLCGEYLETYMSEPEYGIYSEKFSYLDQTDIRPEGEKRQSEFVKKAIANIPRRILMVSRFPNQATKSLFQNGQFGPERLIVQPHGDSLDRYNVIHGIPSDFPGAFSSSGFAKKYDPMYYTNQGRWMSSESEYLARET